MKILQVNNTMNIGGIETFLMNVLRNIDREKFEFVFLTYSDKKFDYEEEINKLGCKIIRISNPKQTGILAHIKDIYKVIKSEQVNVVHCHTYFDSAYVMLAAKLAKVKIRITHSHTAFALKRVNPFRTFKWIVARFMIRLFANVKLACSTEAGRALYGKSKFETVTNGIDFEKFYFNENLRNVYRNQFHIQENDLVIGHVGRFDEAKNHSFLIEILKELSALQKNVKLVLVGTGKLESDIRKLVDDYQLNSKVIFLGNRTDVHQLLNAFDIFVFPSVYEGLPLSVVEVQANGLTALVSSNVSKEIALTPCVQFLDLNKGAAFWANSILEKSTQRLDTKTALSNSEYSILYTIEKLTSIYTKS